MKTSPQPGYVDCWQASLDQREYLFGQSVQIVCGLFGFGAQHLVKPPYIIVWFEAHFVAEVP